MSELYDLLQQKDLKVIWRIFYPNTKEYTFSSTAHGSFSKVDHVLRHKTNLNRWRKTEIIPCVLANHYAIKFKINNNHNSSKCINSWKLNNLLLSDEYVREERGRNILEIKWKWKCKTTKLQGQIKSISTTKIYSPKCLH